jgi:hypothetical protein
MLETERLSLGPYAGRFDGFHSVTAAVSKTCLVKRVTSSADYDASLRRRGSLTV